jgi:hypothetical protein
MDQYAMVAQYTAMKGFFKKKPVGEYLLFAYNNAKENHFLIFQFFKTLDKDLFLVGLVGAFRVFGNRDVEYFFDRLRYDSNIKVLEDHMATKITTTGFIKIQFEKSSSFVGKQIELFPHSSLPDDYFIAKCKMKNNFEPAKSLKIGVDTMDLGPVKMMRAFTSSRIKKIIK